MQHHDSGSSLLTIGSNTGTTSLPPPRNKYLRRQTKSPHRRERGKSATRDMIHRAVVANLNPAA
jgi:hypothetical protein